MARFFGILAAKGLAAAALAVTALAAPALAAEGAPQGTENVQARLVSDLNAIGPGETVQVALVQDIVDHWHTYWRNPGDAGEPTRIDWDLPPGFEAGELIWPTPHALPFEGVLTNYGYEGEVLLVAAITAPETLPATGDVTLRASASWLECADICIPGAAEVELRLPVARGSSAPDRRWGPRIRDTLDNAPRDEGFSAGAERAENAVRVSIADPALAELIARGALAEPAFFPYDASLIDHNAAQPVQYGENGLSLDLTPAFGLRNALPEFTGVLAYEADGARRGVVVTVVPEAAVSIGPAVAAAAASAGAGGAGGGGGGGGGAVGLGGLLGLLIAGFAGGLILNLMPCVFPVLSIKALSLVSSAHDHPGQVRRHGLVFLAGVLASFAVLAGALIALKAAGAGVGWGFQLQNPVFVAALALVMFAIGLNLIGAFEIGGSLQNVGAGLARGGGDLEAFFVGVLAVVVATPCTAPFMAAALGAALTQPAYVAFAVFMAIGLGLAAPFVALSAAPVLSRFLPRPGAWMNVLKQAFAFPMFLTAVWLVWVLAQQTGPFGVLAALASMTALAFLIWVARASGGAAGAVKLALRAGAAGVLALALAGVAATSSMAPMAVAAQVEEGAWSRARVEELRAEGSAVFVDFTAAWCVTCQANKLTSLNRARVREAMAEHGVAFLTADWTNHDAVITEELAAHGRSGVPLYLLYPVDGEPVILPQLLTQDIVVDAIEGLTP